MANFVSIPRLSGRPLVGNLFEFRSDRLGLQRRLARECGDIGWFRMGPLPVLTLSGPELVHAALVEHAYDFIKSRGLNKFGRRLLGDGLLTAEGDQHRRQRKLLAPAFQHKRIANYAAVMVEHAERAQAAWSNGVELDLADEMMKLTLSIVGKTLFDADVATDAPLIAEALTDAMEYIVDAVSLPLPYSWPLRRNRKMRRAVAALDELVYRIIGDRRAEAIDRGDVLSMLLATRDEDDGTGLDDRQVRDEVMTLILAGHETTANTLTWTFHLLLLDYPEAAARLRAELDRVLAGRSPTMQDLPSLPYTLATVKESMRLYPPAYIIGRQAICDVQVGPHTLPAGTLVLVNIFGMHHRADLFPEPERFAPERFLDENEKQQPRGAYLPFGAGARICIGNHFAMMEAQLLLAAIAQRVDFQRRGSAEITPEPLVTLRPKGGLPVRAVRRGDITSAAA